MAGNQTETIRQNIQTIRAAIAKSAARAGREASEVTLLAATKMRSAEEIRIAIDAGIDAAGENRVQELRDKLAVNAYANCPVHLIGPLQTNKVKYVVGRAAMIHSVDSKKLAAEISRLSEKAGVVTDVLIEVNIGGEPSKAGVAPAEAAAFAEAVCALPNIALRGLMAIPPAGEEARRYFAELRAMFESIRRTFPPCFDTLSMGMSHDYAEAVEEGATIVRVGTAIFGARPYPVPAGRDKA